ERLLTESRGVVDQVVHAYTLTVECGRFRRKGLRRSGPLRLDVGLFHRSLFDRPNRYSGDSVEYIGECLVRELNDSAHRLPIDIDVEQNRMGRHVVVPDVVMHQLVMPDLPSGFDIEANERTGVQIVSGTASAVCVVSGVLDVEVYIAQFRID